MKVDWSAQNDKPDHQPGIYHARIRDAELKKSAAGNWMFVLKYEDIEDKTFLTVDYVVTTGKAWQYFGQSKMTQLGFSEKDGGIDPPDLEGRTVFLYLVNEEFEGVTRIKVDNDADDGGWQKGYAHKLPAGYVLGPADPKSESRPDYYAAEGDEDSPF